MNQNGGKVYIVDDDESIRKSLSRLLRASGFEVSTFVSAFDFLKENPVAEGACMLLDIRMPGMTGLELLARLKAEGCELPVVLITGDAEASRDISANSSALACLHKPLQEDELLAVIHEGLSKWQKSN